jgi:hypothetical protein
MIPSWIYFILPSPGYISSMIFGVFTKCKCLRSLGRWDRGFESHSGHGCLVSVCVYSVCVFLCLGSGLATDWSLVQGVLPKTNKLNSVDFSPQANSTDRATTSCRRSQCQLLRIEGVAWSAQWIPTAVSLGVLDRSRYFSIQVAPWGLGPEWAGRTKKKKKKCKNET